MRPVHVLSKSTFLHIILVTARAFVSESIIMMFVKEVTLHAASPLGRDTTKETDHCFGGVIHISCEESFGIHVGP